LEEPRAVLVEIGLASSKATVVATTVQKIVSPMEGN
jgi:hypothetical protein